MREGDGPSPGPVMIKKYANRRLYNTAASSYVTLDHLSRMVRDGTNFVVHDAKTGEDITRFVLTQIIVEEEAKGQNLLPISFLRQLISFYGDSLSEVVPCYLEHSMQAFAQHEEQMRSLMKNALEGFFPFNQFEEMGKQNIAFFERAMRIFTPFYRSSENNNTLKTLSSYQADLEELREKVNVMQKKIDKILHKHQCTRS